MIDHNRTCSRVLKCSTGVLTFVVYLVYWCTKCNDMIKRARIVLGLYTRIFLYTQARRWKRSQSNCCDTHLASTLPPTPPSTSWRVNIVTDIPIYYPPVENANIDTYTHSTCVHVDKLCAVEHKPIQTCSVILLRCGACVRVKWNAPRYETGFLVKP